VRVGAETKKHYIIGLSCVWGIWNLTPAVSRSGEGGRKE